MSDVGAISGDGGGRRSVVNPAASTANEGQVTWGIQADDDSSPRRKREGARASRSVRARGSITYGRQLCEEAGPVTLRVRQSTWLWERTLTGALLGRVGADGEERL